jgi:hypothetical protein
MARRRIMSESEKAATPLSETFLADAELVTALESLAAAFLAKHPEDFTRAGLCAVRDAATVMIYRGAEKDLEAGSEYLTQLKARLREEVEAQRG